MSEQLPQPDETKFNEMQQVAAEAGPEAEARRQEMAQWSDLQGQMTDEASAVEKEFVEQGHRNRAHTAEGVGVYAPEGATAKATPTGVAVKEAGAADETAQHFRSPANYERDSQNQKAA